MKGVAVILVVFEVYSDFWMEVWYGINHFCDVYIWYNDRLVERGGWNFTFFLGCPLDVLELCDNERGCLEKRAGLKGAGKRTRNGNKDNKE